MNWSHEHTVSTHSEEEGEGQETKLFIVMFRSWGLKPNYFKQFLFIYKKGVNNSEEHTILNKKRQEKEQDRVYSMYVSVTLINSDSTRFLFLVPYWIIFLSVITVNVTQTKTYVLEDHAHLCMLLTSAELQYFF